MQKLIATDQCTIWYAAEALHQPAGRAVVQLDRAEREVEGEDGDRDQHHQPAAVEGHRPVAELAPRLAGGRAVLLAEEARRRLDQDVGLAPGNTGVVRLAALHLTPDVGIVARLSDLPLLLALLFRRLRAGETGEQKRDREKKHPHLPLLSRGRSTYW